MRKILISTSNPGKIREIEALINQINLDGIVVSSLAEYSIPEPDEPYDDFMANAIHKAQFYGQATGHMALADDSGLCIEALGGFPGVRSKEFIAECGTLEKAFEEIKSKLGRSNNRAAFFKTALALSNPLNGKYITYQAQIEGVVSLPPRGPEGAGFGFDPIFVPNGFSKTLAELGLEVKNQISSRTQALSGLLAQFSDFLRTPDTSVF